MQQQTDMFVNKEMVTYSSSYAIPNFRIQCNLMVHWDGLNYDFLTAVYILIPGSWITINAELSTNKDDGTTPQQVQRLPKCHCLLL